MFPRHLCSENTPKIKLARQFPEISGGMRFPSSTRHFPVLIEGVIPIDRTLADPYVPGEEFAYWPN